MYLTFLLQHNLQLIFRNTIKFNYIRCHPCIKSQMLQIQVKFRLLQLKSKRCFQQITIKYKSFLTNVYRHFGFKYNALIFINRTYSTYSCTFRIEIIFFPMKSCSFELKPFFMTIPNFCLLFQEELTLQACVIYHHILMYMGDIPGRRSRLGMELTDVIFDGPLKHVSKQLFIINF